MNGVPEYKDKVRGVNHCSSHCRLAKTRGLMYGSKFNAVIGRETLERSMNMRAVGVLKPITALYFPPYTKPQMLAKKRQ
jgi:hypothetical protein